MAEVGKDAIESALEVLLLVTEKSGNLRKELKKEILSAVSTLQNEFVHLKNVISEKESTLM